MCGFDANPNELNINSGCVKIILVEFRPTKCSMRKNDEKVIIIKSENRINVKF